MSAPKIKIYKLPRYFSVNNLAEDRVSKVNDELLPFKEKIVTPVGTAGQDDELTIATNRKLTGIKPGEDKWVEKLTNFTDTEITSNLILSDESDSSSFSYSGSESYSGVLNSGIYNVENIESIVFNPILTGSFALKVMRDTEIIPSSGYTIDGNRIIANGIYRYTVFTSISYRNINEGQSTDFATKYYPVYDGANKFFKPFVFRLKDNSVPEYKVVEGENVLTNHESEMVFYKRVVSEEVLNNSEEDCYYINPSTGHVKINNSAENLYMSYVSISSFARTYIAEHYNWVTPNEWQVSGGHMYLAPDVYVGWTTYTPNSWENDAGQTITRSGGQPCFVEPGSYSISYRNGSVSFASEFDNSDEANQNEANAGKAGCVYVSYSYLCGINNVDSQVFERDYGPDDSDSISSSDEYPYGENMFDYSSLLPGDRVYYPARTDVRDEQSKGAMWVGVTNSIVVKNVYVTYYDEELGKYITEQKPVIVKYEPYDQLTVKSGD